MSLPYVDLKGVAGQFASAVAEENIRAIGTGRGGAGNSLPALQDSTVAKKGHGRQIEDTWDLLTAIRATGSTAAVYSSKKRRGKAPSNMVAEYLVLGTARNAHNKFPFFGCTGGTMARFVEDVVNRIATTWGARVDMGSMASLRRSANRPWIDPGVKAEVHISTTTAGISN